MISLKKVRTFSPPPLSCLFICCGSAAVLGQNGARVFKDVFQRAQHTLRKTFGMELAELPSRAELAAESNEGGKFGELEEARNATGLKKKSTSIKLVTALIAKF